MPSDNQSINLTRIGGTLQSGANVIDSANSAIRVNVVTGPLAAMVRSLPLLNYSSLILGDGVGGLWTLTENDNGTLQVVSSTSGTALPLILNDLTALASWQITVSGGVLAANPITFSLAYPSAMGLITSSGLKSAMFVSAGVISTLHPTSSPDLSVVVTSLPANAAQENGNLALMASSLRGQDRDTALLERIAARLDTLVLMFADSGLKYIETDEVISSIQ